LYGRFPTILKLPSLRKSKDVLRISSLTKLNSAGPFKFLDKY